MTIFALWVIVGNTPWCAPRNEERLILGQARIMAVARIVCLPGIMTGQILSGSPTVEAVKYQTLIMFLIFAGTGFGTLAVA